MLIGFSWDQNLMYVGWSLWGLLLALENEIRDSNYEYYKHKATNSDKWVPNAALWVTNNNSLHWTGYRIYVTFLLRNKVSLIRQMACGFSTFFSQMIIFIFSSIWQRKKLDNQPSSIYIWAFLKRFCATWSNAGILFSVKFCNEKTNLNSSTELVFITLSY